MNTKRILTSLGLLLALALASPAKAHIEIVATFTVEKYDNTYYLRASVDKHLFVQMLKAEADCPASKMIGECGRDYILDHFSLSINGEPSPLEKLSHDTHGHTIDMVFRVEGNVPDLQTLSVTSDCLLAYNDHGQIRVLVNLEDNPVSYNLSPSRHKITYRNS